MDKKTISAVVVAFLFIVIGAGVITSTATPSDNSVAYNDSEDDENYYDDEDDEDYDEDYYDDDDYDYDEDDEYSYSGNSDSASSSSITHYCQATGCYKEGTKTVTGVTGATEYYCQEHYDTIQNTINNMEQDVGSGSASRHTCEECSREGTHTLTGVSGATEYYCTEHYNQIMDMLEEMYDN